MSSLDRILPFLKPIEDLLCDPTVTEVMVNSPEEIYVEKAGKLSKVTSTLDGESRQSSPERAASVTVFWPMARACMASERGLDEASRRAFCILS